MILNPIRNIFKKTKKQLVYEQRNDKYSSFIDLIWKYCDSIENKTVLEIGSDWNGKLLFELKKICHVRQAYGINLNSCDNKLADGIYHLQRDAEKTGFDDNQFDFIFSLATFEHIHNLPAVLKECHRILKDKGVLFTLFGPIWSSAWGHHLWVTIDNKTYNYKNTMLPPFCHLIQSESEVFDYLMREYNFPEFTSAIVVSREELELYPGNYCSFSSSDKLTILLKESQIYGQAAGGGPSFPLEPFDKNKFRFEAARLEFEFFPAENKLIVKQHGSVLFEMIRE